MIAKNYIKFPEALRFQVELFSNGFRNSPRIMRLMTVIFDQRPDVPQWWKDLKNAEGRLIKHWKKALMELFGKTEATAKTAPGQGESEAAKPPVKTIEGVLTSKRWAPALTAMDDEPDMMRIGAGRYRSYCRRLGGGFQGSAKPVGSHVGYWGGFSQ